MKKPRSKILVVITTKRKIQIQKQNGVIMTPTIEIHRETSQHLTDILE